MHENYSNHSLFERWLLPMICRSSRRKRDCPTKSTFLRRVGKPTELKASNPITCKLYLCQDLRFVVTHRSPKPWLLNIQWVSVNFFFNSANQPLARAEMSRAKNLYMMLLLMEHVFSSNYRRFHEYVLTYMKWVSAHMSHCLLAAIITTLEFSLGRFGLVLENAKVFSSRIYSYVARFKLKNQRFLCGFKLNFHAQSFKRYERSVV